MGTRTKHKLPPDATALRSAELWVAEALARAGGVETRNCGAWINEMRNSTVHAVRAMSLFSQFTQDGVLQLLFGKLGTANRHFVEFGFGYDSRDVTAGVMDAAGSGLNTRLLALQGWAGRYFDADVSSPAFNITKAVLTPQNIGQAFADVGLPSEVDYVSIDVDSIDVWLMKGLLAPTSGFRPRVISVEVNTNFPASSRIAFHERWQPWSRRKIYGASAGALNHVAETSGYRLVHVPPRLGDAFFVRNDVLERRCNAASIPTFRDLSRHLPVANTQARCIRDDLNKIVDVPLFLEGRVAEAHRRAITEAHKLTVRQSSKGLQLCHQNDFFCPKSATLPLTRSSVWPKFNETTGLLRRCLCEPACPLHTNIGTR